jgi:hypothetical protein
MQTQCLKEGFGFLNQESLKRLEKSILLIIRVSSIRMLDILKQIVIICMKMNFLLKMEWL